MFSQSRTVTVSTKYAWVRTHALHASKTRMKPSQEKSADREDLCAEAATGRVDLSTRSWQGESFGKGDAGSGSVWPETALVAARFFGDLEERFLLATER